VREFDAELADVEWDLREMSDLKNYIESLVDAGERMRKQLALNTDLLQQGFSAQRNFEEAVKPILEAQKRIADAARSITIPQIEFPAIVLPPFELPDLSLLLAAAELGKSLCETIGPALECIRESIRDLPPRTQEALLLLGTHGWYLDFEWSVPQLWNLQQALSDGNVEEAEKALVERFERRLDAIEKSLIERFPKRAHLIRAALAAHRREEYELSIPVLLAQTDGVCKDLTKKYLFIRENKKPEVAAYVEQFFADTFKASLLSPIGASQHERSDTELLNRHAVLHGESLNYGSQTNSLKAISLINYMAHVL
jgi:hypothetical protein